MTILEHFEKAKADGCEWADAAIRNTSPEILKISEAKNIKDAITGAFAFGESPEGREFWFNVYVSFFDDMESALEYSRQILKRNKPSAQ
jgi:hypothetical protein